MSQPHNPRPIAPAPPRGPIADFYAAGPRPTDAGAYIVLPLCLVEGPGGMDLPWRNGLRNLLEAFHRRHVDAVWPDAYRVHAMARLSVDQCDERQLTAARIRADITDEGELVYFDTDGTVITDPGHRRVYVPTTDLVLQR